ncbi:MAG: ATP-binding protein [Gammaproteobacteria bacterium]|nr:ATP-binding protein [Gammaproteobacteria bacterium]
MKTLQFFISSPGDVYEERTIANRVIERLQTEYAGRLVLDPVLWEHEPLVATSTFQHQIVKPSDTDVVIAILWSRLGTPLPKEFARPDGSRFESGTEYEFEEAIAGHRKTGKPDLLVYRKTAPPSVRLDNEEELLERLAQKKKLDQFVDHWFHDKAEGTLKAAFHQFESASDFETLLENHLHKLVDRQLPKSSSATSAAKAIWRKGSPFRGLASFHFEHAPVFFGRTKAVSDVLQALRRQAANGRSFILILGMSGGGKSSVARAGVLPMLTKPGVIEGVGLWRRAVFRPSDVGGDLFAGLAKALVGEHALPSLARDAAALDKLAQVLCESPQAAVSLIRGALDDVRKSAQVTSDARLALVIDQMEEMYTHDDLLPKHRKAFVDVLDALARCGWVWVICTLRSDFYPRLSRLPKLAALKDGDGQYDLMPPTAAEIGQMIRLPTRAAGLRSEADPAISERLDDDLRDAAVEHPEVLPLLQFTLEELYQRRTDDGLLTLEAYRELGGVEGSLAQRAETVFSNLPQDVGAELPRVLNELVSVEHEGHESIGRKFAPWKEVSKGKSRQLVDAFVENRLFVTELDAHGDAVVTVAHEALLWHWPRVKDWIAQNRQALRVRARIAAAADRWSREERRSDLLLPAGKPLVEAEALLEQGFDLHDDEARFVEASIAKAKRLQRLKVGAVSMIAILAVAAGGAAFVANNQRDLANEARLSAEIDAETARQTTDFMVGLFEVADPSEALGNTITAREIMDRGAERIARELSDQPIVQATLMETMGTVYTSLGLYEGSANLLRKALDTRRTVHGTYHVEVARTMHRLGQVLKLKAEFGPAEANFRASLAMRRDILGNENSDTVESIVELADLLLRRDKYFEAEVLLREALELQNALGLAQSAQTARILRVLALCLHDQGLADEPVPLMNRAVALLEELHDGPYPQLAEALNDLGYLLSDAGQAQESERIFRNALQMKRKLLGDAHPEIATGLNNVAFALYDQGRYEDSNLMHREALAMQRDLLGDAHPDVADSFANLAFLSFERGQLKEAVSFANEALAVYQRAFGKEHAAVADAMYNLAIWTMQNDEYLRAEGLLLDARRIHEKLLGADHSDVASDMTVLANIYVMTERFDEALTVAANAHRIQSRALGDKHWRTAAAASAQGAAMSHTGQSKEAEALLLESFRTLEADPPFLPFYLDNTTRWLADHYQRNGNTNEAAKYRALIAQERQR